MQVKTQLDDLQNYLTDASNMPGGHADKLFLPESADEVAAILRDANGTSSGNYLRRTDRNGRRGDPVWRLCDIAGKTQQDKERSTKRPERPLSGRASFWATCKKPSTPKACSTRPTQPNGAARSAELSRRMRRVQGALSTERREFCKADQNRSR